MSQLLPLPPWDAIHPLVVHFPIALLLVAPLLVIAGALVRGEHGRGWLHAALLLMLLGTAGTFVAVASGEAGEGAAERVAGTKDLLHEHEEAAELARNSFTVLTIGFALIVCAPRLTKKEPGRVATTLLPLLFLLPYAVAMLVLANAAHQGGRLVHERGVYAHWNGGPPAPAGSGAPVEHD